MFGCGKVDGPRKLATFSKRAGGRLGLHGQLNRVRRLKPEDLVTDARKNKRAMLMLSLRAAGVGGRKLRLGSRRGINRPAGTFNLYQFAVLETGRVPYRKLVAGGSKLADQQPAKGKQQDAVAGESPARPQLGGVRHADAQDGKLRPQQVSCQGRPDVSVSFS